MILGASPNTFVIIFVDLRLYTTDDNLKFW